MAGVAAVFSPNHARNSRHVTGYCSPARGFAALSTTKYRHYCTKAATPLEINGLSRLDQGCREDFPMSLLQQVSFPVEAGFGLWWFQADSRSFMPIRAVPSDSIGFALRKALNKVGLKGLGGESGSLPASIWQVLGFSVT